MSAENNPLVNLTSDVDKTLLWGPPAVKTLAGMLRGNLILPQPGTSYGEYRPSTGIAGILLNRFSVFFHQIRTPYADSLEGLQMFQAVADEFELNLQMSALSGRDQSLHEMTRERLDHYGYGNIFQNYHLNQGRSSSLWKEHTVRTLAHAGPVVHLEDDMAAGLCVARVAQEFERGNQVIVYMRSNPTTDPNRIQRAHIQVPPNMFFVDSIPQAAIDFKNKLQDGQIPVEM